MTFKVQMLLPSIESRQTRKQLEAFQKELDQPIIRPIPRLLRSDPVVDRGVPNVISCIMTEDSSDSSHEER